MISTCGGSPARSGDGAGGARDRANLHLVDLRVGEPEPAAARPEHRVGLVERADPRAHLLARRLLLGRQELVQRRIEQPDRHREAVHRLEDPLEVGLLEGQQPVERGAAGGFGVGQDHLLHHGQPLLAEEHVLGPAEADPLGAELARAGRVGGRVAVRAHAQTAVPVGPAEDRLEVLVELRRDELDRARVDIAGAAVDRDRVALVQLVAPDPGGAVLEGQAFAAGDARLAHPAGDDRRMRGHAAVNRQNAGGGDHAVDVVGRRLVANEDDRAGLRLLDGGVGVEDDAAARRARARVQALRDRLGRRVGVDPRVQQLVELRRVDAGDGVVAARSGLPRPSRPPP